MSEKKAPMITADSGWKSLDEQNLSPSEFNSEKLKRTIGFIIGPLAFIILLLMPTPAGMTDPAQQVLAITAWTILWWVLEPIPIPASALIPFILIPIMGIMPAADAFAFFGHTNIFLMIGVFIFVGVMIQQGFAKRIALWLLSRKFASKSSASLMTMYIVAMAIISAFMSNIPATMLFLMIAKGICEAIGVDDTHPYSKALKFSAAYGSQAGGLATPIGAPNTNFLAMGLMLSLCGCNVRFADWMAVGAPFAVIICVISILYFRRIFKSDLGNMEAARQYAQNEYDKLGPLRKGEKISIFLVFLAIVLWIVPSIVSAILGDAHPAVSVMDRVLNASIVSIFVAILAFLIPLDWKKRKFSTTWGEAAGNVNWGVLILVSCGFLLGGAMNAEGVKLIGWFAKKISGVLGDAPGILVILGFTVLAMVITQFISNVPAISIITTMSVPVAMATNLNPVALAFAIAMAAQMSYVLPVAAPQMAIAYGSGGLKLTEFARVGILQCIFSIPVIVIFVYYWANFLFPMGSFVMPA